MHGSRRSRRTSSKDCLRSLSSKNRHQLSRYRNGGVRAGDCLRPFVTLVRGRRILGSSRLQAGADLASKAAGCSAHYPCPPRLRASSWDLWREIVTSSGDLLRFNFTRISRKRGTYLSRVEDRHFP